jgi:hypothetical protein
MKDPFLLFWSVLIFASIAWYAFLVFYVGWKAGREVRDLTRSLSAASSSEEPPARP